MGGVSGFQVVHKPVFSVSLALQPAVQSPYPNPPAVISQVASVLCRTSGHYRFATGREMELILIRREVKDPLSVSDEIQRLQILVYNESTRYYMCRRNNMLTIFSTMFKYVTM